MSTWLHQRLAQVPQDHTAALLIDHSEVQELDCLKHLAGSTDFRQDLSLNQAMWVYMPHSNGGDAKRVLLLQQKNKKPKESTEEKKEGESDADDGVDKELEGQKKTLQGLGSTAASQLRGMKISKADVIASSKINADILGEFTASLHSANFEFSQRSYIGADEDFKGDEADPRKTKHHSKIDDFSVSHESANFAEAQAYKEKMASARATEYARSIANIRGSEADPCFMEAKIWELVKGNANISEVRVLKGQELQDLGMNLFYEVGKGAMSEPRCVLVDYRGNPESGKVDVALVGKGLTFDTGGLNLKPTRAIEDMHLDKGGACAVMGALHGTMSLNLKKNIVFVMALAENAIGAEVYKPGDIIKSLKGHTVEVGNTDAEGRLVLADAITYTCREYQPEALIDIATLTGSIMVALGEETAGLFSNDDTLADDLLKAGKDSNETLWRMPIMAEHRKGIKRTASDLNNCGSGRYADASSAAAFIESFLEKQGEGDKKKNPKWAHLDIAGTCMNKKIGCTGFGSDLLLHYLKKE